MSHKMFHLMSHKTSTPSFLTFVSSCAFGEQKAENDPRQGTRKFTQKRTVRKIVIRVVSYWGFWTKLCWCYSLKFLWDFHPNSHDYFFKPSLHMIKQCFCCSKGVLGIVNCLFLQLIVSKVNNTWQSLVYAQLIWSTVKSATWHTRNYISWPDIKKMITPYKRIFQYCNWE